MHCQRSTSKAPAYDERRAAPELCRHGTSAVLQEYVTMGRQPSTSAIPVHHHVTTIGLPFEYHNSTSVVVVGFQFRKGAVPGAVPL